VGVKSTEQRRLECLHINIRGTSNVLDAKTKQKEKKVIKCNAKEPINK
jgi:FlaA1/EpsC-like NDP-sugar epimerase